MFHTQNIPYTPLWTQIPTAEIPQPAVPLEPIAQFRLAALQSRANALMTQFREGSFPVAGGNGRNIVKKKDPAMGKTSSDAAFLKQILSDGTHQDKLSALILLVRESPIHRIDELERLRVMAGGSSGESVVKGGGGREERMSVMRALGDWWVSGGGKESGKLR